MNMSNAVVGRLQNFISLLVAVTIGLSAFALHTADVSMQTFVMFALGFAIVLGLWLRLQSIFEAQMCRDRFSVASTVLMAFGFALMPFLLPSLIDSRPVTSTAPARLLPLSLAIMQWLMAAIVQRWLSQSMNQSPTVIADWQHVRNALVAGAALYLLSIAVPPTTPGIFGLSAQSLLWMIVVIAQPLYLMLMRRSTEKVPAPAMALNEAGGLTVTTAIPAPQSKITRSEQAHGHRRRGGRGRRRGRTPHMSGSRRRI